MIREPGVRLFLAVALAVEPDWDDLQQTLRALAADPAHGLRLLRPEDLHITLKFLGKVPLERVPDVTRIAREAADQSSPFQVKLQGVGWFRNAIWVSVEEEAKAHPLTRLAGLLDLQLAASGFPAETRPYRPHLTLARLAPGARIRLSALGEEFGARGWGALPVTAIHLYRSQTLPEGARYTIVGSWPLRG
jgi:2'-5' RNA ligase